MFIRFIPTIRQFSFITICSTTMLFAQSSSEEMNESSSKKTSAESWREREEKQAKELAREVFDKFLDNFRVFEQDRKIAPQSVEDAAREYIRHAISDKQEDNQVLNFEKGNSRRTLKNIKEWGNRYSSSHILFSRLEVAFLVDLMHEEIISPEECKEALLCNAKIAKYLLRYAKVYDEKPPMTGGVYAVIRHKVTATDEDKRAYLRWKEEYARAKKAKAEFLSSLKADIQRGQK